MVRTLHEADIEVILDVVYNHTAEGNHLGPTLSMRGIDNAAYYRLVEDDQRYYTDYTGTYGKERRYAITHGLTMTLLLLAMILSLVLRYEHSATILTSNRPLEDWGQILGDTAAVGAMLDRFLHHAEVVRLVGRSHRMHQRQQRQAAHDTTSKVVGA